MGFACMVVPLAVLSTLRAMGTLGSPRRRFAWHRFLISGPVQVVELRAADPDSQAFISVVTRVMQNLDGVLGASVGLGALSADVSLALLPLVAVPLVCLALICSLGCRPFLKDEVDTEVRFTIETQQDHQRTAAIARYDGVRCRGTRAADAARVERA